jgi:hypothetical protein
LRNPDPFSPPPPPPPPIIMTCDDNATIVLKPGGTSSTKILLYKPTTNLSIWYNHSLEPSTRAAEERSDINHDTKDFNMITRNIPILDTQVTYSICDTHIHTVQATKPLPPPPPLDMSPLM